MNPEQPTHHPTKSDLPLDAHPLVVEQYEQAWRIVSCWHFLDAVAPTGNAKTARLPSGQ